MGGVRFTPGMNDVDEKILKDFTPHLKAAYKRKVAAGIFIEVKEKTSVTAKMVRDTADLSLLEVWERDKTIKGPVKTAIRKQISEIRSVEPVEGDETEVL